MIVQRLTALDSNSEDFEDDLSLVDLDSPHGLVGEEEDEEEEELCPALSSAQGTRAAAAHTCDECLKSFASPGKLRQHEYSHTGETPFECRIQGGEVPRFIVQNHGFSIDNSRAIVDTSRSIALCDANQYPDPDPTIEVDQVNQKVKSGFRSGLAICGCGSGSGKIMRIRPDLDLRQRLMLHFSTVE